MPRFFVKSGNYFETTTEIDTPPDAVSVPQRPAANWSWDGAAWVEGPPIVPDFDAIADELSGQINRNGTLIQALGFEVFQLAKIAEPTLTAAQFTARIRNRIRAGLNP